MLTDVKKLLKVQVFAPHVQWGHSRKKIKEKIMFKIVFKNRVQKSKIKKTGCIKITR
jgi:hypothetical protein